MRIERGPVRFDIESNGYGPFETRIERGWFRSIFESNGATRSVENRSIRSNGVGQQPRHMPKNASVFDFAWLRTRNGTRKRVEANSSPVVVARQTEGSGTFDAPRTSNPTFYTHEPVIEKMASRHILDWMLDSTWLEEECADIFRAHPPVHPTPSPPASPNRTVQASGTGHVFATTRWAVSLDGAGRPVKPQKILLGHALTRTRDFKIGRD
ncbi:hypothetical protein Purlil1_12330 [Purpureocillium lilacinum]|uniref:Uncharacterized protein n=1 Tax=Purpureocillium lilacinum TaxID=33203 RepID=A0ABR0BHR9_PURLI|nr:hypothetical protein Purlil1_12330 [Purpureocillium lilacinum]